MSTNIKRIYSPADKSDGCRILIDRLWPRGISKENAKIDHWLKDIAPSQELRQWFGHDPQKWGEFKRRYHKELLKSPGAVQWLKVKATKERVTLLYAASDEKYNNAVALRALLKLLKPSYNQRFRPFYPHHQRPSGPGEFGLDQINHRSCRLNLALTVNPVSLPLLPISP